MGWALYIISWVMSIYPYILVAVVFTQFNPVSLFCFYIFGPTLPWMDAFIWIPRLLQFLTFLTACRTIGIAIVFLIVTTYSFLATAWSVTAFKRYRQALLFLKYSEEDTCVLCLIIHTVGFYVEVCFFYIAVMSYKRLPKAVYLFCVTLAVLVLIAISVMMPMIVDIHEVSLHIIREGKRALAHKRDIRFKRKLLASLEPYKLYGGIGNFRFYFNQRSTKITYYEIILTYLIDAILGFKL